MALTPEDLEVLASLIDSGIKKVIDDRPVPAAPAENHGQPDAANSTENAPVYYVHLANGEVIETKDSASTHMDRDGVSVAVIGRYPKGE
jgi:hypothetical protein